MCRVHTPRAGTGIAAAVGFDQGQGIQAGSTSLTRSKTSFSQSESSPTGASYYSPTPHHGLEQSLHRRDTATEALSPPSKAFDSLGYTLLDLPGHYHSSRLTLLRVLFSSFSPVSAPIQTPDKLRGRLSLTFLPTRLTPALPVSLLLVVCSLRPLCLTCIAVVCCPPSHDLIELVSIIRLLVTVEIGPN